MKNMWEFPEAECGDGEDPRAALAREAQEKYGLDLTPGRELAKVKHSIMNRRIVLRAYAAKLERRPPRIGKRKWVSPEELLNLPTSSMIHKVLGKLNPDG
jgi:8-oxo-dGTP pyrophosphatase MutT (NUDIX family)